MDISRIPYSILSIESTLNLAIQCDHILSTKHAEDALLSSALAGVNKAMSMVTLAIASSNKKELTRELNLADRKRDRLFIGLRKRIDTDLYKDFDPSAQQAAVRLLKIVKKHGTQLYLEKKSVESALLMSFFEDLDTEHAKADLLTIGLTDWLNALKQAQDKFVIVQQKRNELESGKEIPTNEEAKRALVEKLSTLLKGLDFLADTQPDSYAGSAQLIMQAASDIVSSERISQ